MYKSFVTLGRYTPKYFILFVAMVNGIVSLISLSVFSLLVYKNAREFCVCILSYLPSKTMGCFSGRLMSTASDQKSFCELCSAFNCSFAEFVGEKVVSLSYSSAILAPPSRWFLDTVL